MTPAAIAAAYRRQISAYGEPVTLWRPATETAAEVRLENLRARVRSFLPRELTGEVQQGDRKVILLAEDVAGFPLPILSGIDRVIWGGRTLVVTAVDDATRRVAGTPIAYDLTVTGA